MPTITYAMLSRTGTRTQNEDAIQMEQYQKEYLFALADGLGGHGKGDMASRCVVTQSVRAFRAGAPKGTFLDYAFQSSQECLLQQKQAAGTASEMKTTLVLLHVNEKTAQWGFIGDSRLYYFENGRLAERTLDHSVPQRLAMSGEIKESQIRNHPERNKVLRVMGSPWEGPSYELSSPVELQGEQDFLLCTDGFWELIEEKDMEKTLRRSGSTAQWLQEMESIVLQKGAGRDMDNYSAVCVSIR